MYQSAAGNFKIYQAQTQEEKEKVLSKLSNVFYGLRFSYLLAPDIDDPKNGVYRTCCFAITNPVPKCFLEFIMETFQQYKVKEIEPYISLETGKKTFLIKFPICEII